MKIAKKYFVNGMTVFCFIFANTANALEVKNSKPQDAMSKRNQNKASTALTERECGDLGGLAIPTTKLCKSKLVCSTQDQNGETHFVCISKK
jgi:hypothetical protein